MLSKRTAVIYVHCFKSAHCQHVKLNLREHVRAQHRVSFMLDDEFVVYANGKHSQQRVTFYSDVTITMGYYKDFVFAKVFVI